MSGLFESAIRGLAGLLSPAGPRARLSILIYHRVLSEPDPIITSNPTGDEFEAQMRVIRTHFNVLPLSEAVERLKGNALPARAACVTFDDGYADNAQIALPILRRLRVPATFFVATAYLNGGRMFNDTVIESVRQIDGSTLTLDDPAIGSLDISSNAAKRAAIKKILDVWRYLPVTERQARADGLGAHAKRPLPSDLMMSDEQVSSLRTAGMEIGAHTATHPILPRISSDDARNEIAASREHLEALLREPVRLFAYPNGRPMRDYLAEHVRMVRELGFEAAVSTAPGVATTASDLYQLPRFTPWDRDPVRFFTRLVGNLRRVSAEQVPAG